MSDKVVSGPPTPTRCSTRKRRAKRLTEIRIAVASPASVRVPTCDIYQVHHARRATIRPWVTTIACLKPIPRRRLTALGGLQSIRLQCLIPRYSRPALVQVTADQVYRLRLPGGARVAVQAGDHRRQVGGGAAPGQRQVRAVVP